MLENTKHKTLIHDDVIRSKCGRYVGQVFVIYSGKNLKFKDTTIEQLIILKDSNFYFQVIDKKLSTNQYSIILKNPNHNDLQSDFQAYVNNSVYDFSYNCHGHSLFKNNGWHSITDVKDFNSILNSKDMYKAKDLDRNKNAVILFLKDTEVIHSCKYDSKKQIFSQKIGCLANVLKEKNLRNYGEYNYDDKIIYQ